MNDRHGSSCIRASHATTPLHKRGSWIGIFKPNSRKIHNWNSHVISRPRFERFRRNLAQWRSSTLQTRPTVKNSKFRKSKMAAAVILRNWKITISRPRLEQFWRNLSIDAVLPFWPFRPLKIDESTLNLLLFCFTRQGRSLCKETHNTNRLLTILTVICSAEFTVELEITRLTSLLNADRTKTQQDLLWNE